MGKVIRKSLGAVLMIAALIVTQIPALGTEAVVQSPVFLMDHNILAEYTGTSTNVSVPADVVTIGEEAFANNQYIGVVYTGDNTKHIGHGAFANCSYLMGVTLGGKVENIDSAAFSGCTNLQSVSIGADVNNVGTGIFAGCQNLTRVMVDTNNRYLKSENQVLYDADQSRIYSYFGGNTRDIYVMPNSVEHIEPYSFWGNTYLEDVTLSGSLEEVSGYAFSNCTSLRTLTIPYSVHSIDAKAFENCISLQNVIIPASVSYIDPTAFDGCSKLNIIADEGTVAYEFFRNFDRSDIGNTENQDTRVVVEEIEKPVVDSTHYLDASKDPRNVEWMPSVDSLSSGNDSSILGKTIIVSGDALLFINKDMQVKELSRDNIQNQSSAGVNDSLETGSGENVVYDSDKGGYLPKYTEVNGKIAMQAYYGAKDMDGYELPAGTNSIGRFAFARSNISSLVIPEGVTSIGYGAFYHCDNLSNIIFPASLTNIDEYAFDHTPYIKNALSSVDGNGMLIVGDGILLAYGGSGGDVVIPSSVKYIADGCFRDNKTITGISFPDSVIRVGSDAFRDCSSLTRVSFGNGLKEIGDRAFMGCPCNNLRIPASVESMGLRAVDYANTNKSDDSRVVIFEGGLPSIKADETSMRLSNNDYRSDVLHNVIFAVVDDSVNAYDNTVLDGKKLGFSGMILSLNDDNTANIKANYIFSDEVIRNLPRSISVDGESYNILGIDETKAESATRATPSSDSSLRCVYNGGQNEKVSARLTAKSDAGILSVNESDLARNALISAYSKLFGGENPDMTGYDVQLRDVTDTCNIDKLGNSSLSVTIPYECADGAVVHAVTLDEDGQLEELKCTLDANNGTITFATTHLSYVGIYTNGDGVLTLKDGRLVQNHRLDSSPDTGDYSIPVNYVIAVAMFSTGLILILIRTPRRRNKKAA